MKNPIKNRNMSPVVPVLIAIAVGGAIALLLAPESGEGTRKAIANSAKKSWDALTENINISKDDISALTEKAIASIKSITQAGADKLNDSVASIV